MSCNQVRTALVSGASLSEAERAHAAQCQDCRGLAVISSALTSELRGELSNWQVPPSHVRRIALRAWQRRARPPRNWRPARVALAAAALLAIGFGLGRWTGDADSPRQPAIAHSAATAREDRNPAARTTTGREATAANEPSIQSASAAFEDTGEPAAARPKRPRAEQPGSVPAAASDLLPTIRADWERILEPLAPASQFTPEEAIP